MSKLQEMFNDVRTAILLAKQQGEKDAFDFKGSMMESHLDDSLKELVLLEKYANELIVEKAEAILKYRREHS